MFVLNLKKICQILYVGFVNSSNVVKIGNKKGFRAKVLNLLMVTSRLRTTEGFKNIYILKNKLSPKARVV